MGEARTAESLLPAWRDALLAGDVDALTALYEPDAVYYVPALGIAARGREAIAAQWRATFAQWRAVAFDVIDQQLDVHDDLASSWLRATLTVEHRDGSREEIAVRAADVFRRGDDGCWRYAVDHA